MSAAGEERVAETAEELYEDAPCGYLSCRPDGTITRVNRTFAAWTGHAPGALVGRRFSDLLTAAGRIYHETHFAPLLQMQGAVREIALDIVRSDGSRLPALVNAVQHEGADGRPASVRTTIFDATDRRRYERELLEARRREQQIAHELQQSLLTGELPEAATLTFDVFYRSAVAGVEVGGDWYDAFWLDERRVALVVGDVVGRGIAAAATMGQLRSATRALASSGLSPGPLLDALDRYSAQHGIGRMTTVGYVELDLGTGRLLHAAAGHPPPLLVDADAGPAFLDGGRSVPLDAGFGDDPRPEDGAQLRPGSALLLYTDGLVERRDRPLSDGLDRLIEEMRADPDVSAASLARRLGADARQDDVCVVAARAARPSAR